MERGEFETLVRGHQAGVYRYLRYLGANEAVSANLTRETFLAVLREKGYPDFRDPVADAAWLRKTARTLLARYCRDVKKDTARSGARFHDEAEAFYAAQFLRGGDGFPYIAALARVLERLPPSERRMLDLFYTEKRSREDIASLLGMSVGEMTSRLRRIRRAVASSVESELAGGTRA